MKVPHARCWPWAVCAAYILLLHLALGITVVKTNFLFLVGKTFGWIPPEEWVLGWALRAIDQATDDATVPANKIILLGDSLVEQIENRAGVDFVNFGIGGDTTRTLRARLPVLQSIRRSRGVVLEVGVNDLKYRLPDQIGEDYAALLSRLGDVPWVLAVSVLPIDETGVAARERPYLRNRMIDSLNRELRLRCDAVVRCHWLDAHKSFNQSMMYKFDGWHLSEEGNTALVQVIRSALPDAQ